MSTAPLAGLKVLELARILAGPWAGQTLADLGADVVKIESPEGDDTRRWGPPFLRNGDEVAAAYFHSCNRGKRSIALDLKQEAGRSTARRLAAAADVLIENYKVGGLARFGLDYDSVAAINPGIVYCSITGFGQSGPYAHRPGYDYIIQGMCGLMSVTGDPEGQPQKVGVAVTDILTGLYACIGALAALRRREATGRGEHVDVALLDTGVGIMANQAMNYLVTGVPPARVGNAHRNLAPYQVFDCADGYLIIATGNDSQFRRLCRLLGCPELADDPRFLENADRVANHDELTRLLTVATRRQNRADLLASCEAAAIPVGPINDLAEVFSDPQVLARRLRIEPEDIPGVRTPLAFSDSGLALDHASPRLDQHGRELAGGWSPRE